MNELIQNNNFKVRLSSPPAGSVNIAFPFSTLRFDTCALNFNAVNWDQWQTIQLASPPVFAASNPIAYPIPFAIRNATTNAVIGTSNYNVNRTPVRGPTGSSSGDPHYTQFNGHYYSDQSQATVYLVNHEHFSVQALQQRCNSLASTGPSCNQAVAVRYGSSALIIDARDRVVTVGRLTSNVDGLVYSSSKSTSHVISFPDGSYVSISASAWTQQYGVHISVTVALAPHWSNYGGILNDPSVPKGSFKLRNGSITKNAGQFTNDWVVPPSDNLFNGNLRLTTPSFKPRFCSQPTTLFTNSLAMYVVKYTIGNPQKRQIDDGSSNIPDFDALASQMPPAFLTNAKSVCSAAISSTSGCASVADTGSVVESCYRDAILTNSLNFTSDHFFNFNQLCLGATRSLEDSGSEEDAFKALMIQQKDGLGEFPCPRNCNSRGKCVEFGCECTAGFTGASCEIKL